MNLFLASVHHTGTHFTADLFERHGFRYSRHRPPPVNNKRDSIWHLHVRRNLQQRILAGMEAADFTIVPIRHPRLCAESWARRNASIETMIGQWTMLFDELEPLGVVYFPIDAEDRNTHLKRVNDRLGLEMTTDWPLIGKQALSPKPISDANRQEVEDLCEKYKANLDRIYSAHVEHS